MRSFLLSVLSVLLAASSAAAEPAASSWQSRRFAVNVAISPWGSPTGLVGVSADEAFAPWFSLSEGVGLGGVIYHGPKGGPTPLVALSARFRVGGREKAATAAVGISMGPYAVGTYCVDCDDGGDTVWAWDWAVWSDVSIGYELRRHDGIALQVNAGAEYLLNSSSDACYQMAKAYGGEDYQPCASQAHHVVFPFVQLQVGYAF